MEKRTLLKEIINVVYDGIDNLEGIEVYLDDLSYTLSEAFNLDGTVEYSRKATREKFNEWTDEYETAWEMLVDHGYLHGFDINPFREPEKIDVMVYSVIISNIVWSLPVVRNYEDIGEEFEITKEFIEEFQKELEEFPYDYVWELQQRKQE